MESRTEEEMNLLIPHCTIHDTHALSSGVPDLSPEVSPTVALRVIEVPFSFGEIVALSITKAIRESHLLG